MWYSFIALALFAPLQLQEFLYGKQLDIIG
jgi:hypothetical protein